MTLEALAQASGVSARTISGLVGPDASSPSLDTVVKLATALGVSMIDLLSESGVELEPPAPNSRTARELGRLVEDYLVSSREGQRRIAAVAADEAEKGK
jgi:transcriptional regulator with XRE-family HTH domain